MKYILVAVFLFSVLDQVESAGFLRLHLTADSDCLLHLAQTSHYSETVRLLAYETRTVDIYIHKPVSKLSLSLQPLHHFSGNPIADMEIQEFKTENTGRWDSRVVDSDSVILSVQTTFYCETGYFGPHCEHKSRNIETTTVTLSTESSSSSSSQVVSFDFEISDSTIIYSSLAFLVLLIIIFNICIFCCRPKPIKVFQDTLPLDNSGPKVFCIDEYSGYNSNESSNATRYFDAPSRFISSTTLQSMV